MFIVEGAALIHARLKAAMAGIGGAYLEAHELDGRTARRVPKRSRGRVLSQAEAAALLERIA